MEGENTGENQGETISPKQQPRQLVRRDRVAVCTVCSNEWVSRTGNAKKPAKCPVCGTKKCVWKDEISTEPEKTHGNTTETHGENREIEGEEIEKTEKAEREIAGYIHNPVTGADHPVIAKSSKAAKHDPEPEVNPDPAELKAGGFPVLLVVGGLVVLGCLAGVGWFLGRRAKPVREPVSAVFRPPTAAERAMNRVGVF